MCLLGCTGGAALRACAVLLAALRAVMIVAIGESRHEFGLRQALLVGREFLDHLRRDFASRRRRGPLGLRAVLTCALLATGRGTVMLAALRAAAEFAAAALRAALSTGAAMLLATRARRTALTAALRGTMRAQRFQRLRQFAHIELAVFVRVEFRHQLFSHLFRAGTLMLLSALLRASALTATVEAATLAAGLLCVDRQCCHHERCDCQCHLHGPTPVVRLLCHRVHVRKMRAAR